MKKAIAFSAVIMTFGIFISSFVTSLACLTHPDEDTGKEGADGNDGDDGDDGSSDELSVCTISNQDAYNIIGLEIEDTTLHVSVSYSGGCENHTWQLCWDGTISNSYPGMVWLELGHNANGDSCEMAIEETLSFDISSLGSTDDPLTVSLGGQSVAYGDWDGDTGQ